MTIRLVIADDHGVLRAGLRALLNAEPDMQVVGEAASGREALRLVAELTPDILLLDINMPDPGGLEVLQQLQTTAPAPRVLILTFYEDEALLRQAIEAGACGYITKRAIESELIDAVRAVQRGELYIHPSMTRALLAPAPTTLTDSNLVEQLTPREIEVLRYIAQGYTNRQIADELCISVRTVESHRANLTAKLGLRGRVELVRYAREHGLID